MKIVTISNEFINKFALEDDEFMYKHGRPCIVIVRLKFRNKRHDFAVPFRSNISPNTPKSQYFPLPPRPTTKPNHRHGVHYIKMFPIEKKYLRKFNTDNNNYYQIIENVLNKNHKTIISDCQKYLDNYEKNGKPQFAVDIDKMINLTDK